MKAHHIVAWPSCHPNISRCEIPIHRDPRQAWLTWVSFLSIFIAVFIVVVAVTVRDRPAAAPQTGDFDLGYRVIGHPDFVAGITAVAAIFSAGGTVKKVAYGVGPAGLLVSACIWVHTAAKYLFVRILRGSRHLQANTATHWATWLGCSFSLSVVAFLLAVAIPIFNDLVALCGSLTFAPLALGLPAYLFIYDHANWRNDGKWWMSVVYWLNWLLIPLAAFLTIGGTYGVIQGVIDAYAKGDIGVVFSCADIPGSV